MHMYLTRILHSDDHTVFYFPLLLHNSMSTHVKKHKPIPYECGLFSLLYFIDKTSMFKTVTFFINTRLQTLVFVEHKYNRSL